MRAGNLKYKVTILAPRVEVNDYGAQSISFTPTAVVHAERVKLSGTRSLEVGETFADYDVVFNIRDAHEVHENWRLQQIGGNLYSVTNIIPNHDRGYNTLQCVRVNE